MPRATVAYAAAGRSRDIVPAAFERTTGLLCVGMYLSALCPQRTFIGPSVTFEKASRIFWIPGFFGSLATPQDLIG